MGSVDLDGTVDLGAFEYFNVADTDGDGFLETDEVIAGTNPGDSNSYWRVSGLSVASGIQFTTGVGCKVEKEM